MKRFIALLTALFCLLCACGKAEAPSEKIRLGGMTGPTSMGLIKLIDSGEYDFSLKTEASAFSAALAKGEIDIAAVPMNLAAIIYNNTDGGIRLLAANTLGVLYIVERGESVLSIDDLDGRRLYATGAGAVPEFTLRYLLDRAKAEPDIQWCSDTTEVLSHLQTDENALAMLPQPFVTVAQTKLDDLRVALDLGELWRESGTEVITGALVVRTEFAETHAQEIADFMQKYRESVEFCNSDTDAAAALIGKHEIVPEAVAKKALPACNICCIEGGELKEMTGAYLAALYDMYPQAVGGVLPDQEFYYVEK